MKKITKDYSVRPDSLQASKKKYIDNLKKVVADGKWDEKATLYRTPSVKKALQKIYNNKCAYCESTPMGNTLQVEHFRPKDKQSKRTKSNKTIIHNGYYWLGFEWSNLLLACGNCNTKKSAQFPLKKGGVRVTTPTLLPTGEIDESANDCRERNYIDEKPLLINPEMIDPRRHLSFLPSGKMLGITDEGNKSIEVYDLNRDELVIGEYGRKRKLDEISESLFEIIKDYKLKEKNLSTTIKDLDRVITKEIIKPIIENASFSEFYKFVLLNYEALFVRILPDTRNQQALDKAFQQALQRFFPH